MITRPQLRRLITLGDAACAQLTQLRKEAVAAGVEVAAITDAMALVARFDDALAPHALEIARVDAINERLTTLTVSA